jgi:FkbM family methyltransferase
MLSKFISYAQNFEDVMLWRALKNYPPGSYVDVGAHDPVHFSVTKAFYERGWRGINIDAVTELVERLKKDRPEDINHALFVGAGESTIDFFQIGDTGISTYSEDYAERHQSFGHKISKIQVEMRTLTSILQESEIDNDNFHFLKIDVEGAETDVLLGLDLEKFRPWIIVIEATEPNSTKLSLAFEPLILDKNYRYVYFDGLNRFYVAKERLDLVQAFQSPPCVFDDFDLWETVQAREAVLSAQAHAKELNFQLSRAHEARASALDERLLEVRVELAEVREELAKVTEELNNTWNIVHLRDSRIHSLHAAIIHFEGRISRLHSNFTREYERLMVEGMSKALKTLYSSVTWKRGSLIAKLFRSKSPRGSLNTAASSIVKSNSRHDQALKKLREDMTQVIDAPVNDSEGRRHPCKSAAVVASVIYAGYNS